MYICLKGAVTKIPCLFLKDKQRLKKITVLMLCLVHKHINIREKPKIEGKYRTKDL